jgi:succinyl-diaminopimelate desuccinylase
VTDSDELHWLRDVVVELLRAPTQVPNGQTEIQPGDVAVMDAVSNVVLPRVQDLGPAEVRRHPHGDLAARFGPRGDSGLLLQTYVVSQHANSMDPNRAGEILDADDGALSGARVLGQGASQNKGALASALTALRSMPGDLKQPVWLTVNTEGMSSHRGSMRILDDLGIEVAAGILVVGTDLRVSLGNRGRVDVRVTVRGESCHSSQPWLGRNPIENASDLIVALRSLPLPDSHPVLGPASATPYQFICAPISPHTIPSHVRVMIDRRLLPDESPEGAMESLRAYLLEHMANADLSIDMGEVMLPATVDIESSVVVALLASIESVTEAPGQAFWSLNTFDAGYACSKGIPTVMFGPGRRSFAGSGLLGDDHVSFQDMWSAVGILRQTIRQLCGG